MAPKKQMVIHNGTLSKGMTNTIVRGTDPSHAIDRECLTEDDGFSSQRATTNACLPPLYEG